MSGLAIRRTVYHGRPSGTVWTISTAAMTIAVLFGIISVSAADPAMQSVLGTAFWVLFPPCVLVSLLLPIVDSFTPLFPRTDLILIVSVSKGRWVLMEEARGYFGVLAANREIRSGPVSLLEFRYFRRKSGKAAAGNTPLHRHTLLFVSGRTRVLEFTTIWPDPEKPMQWDEHIERFEEAVAPVREAAQEAARRSRLTLNLPSGRTLSNNSKWRDRWRSAMVRWRNEAGYSWVPGPELYSRLDDDNGDGLTYSGNSVSSAGTSVSNVHGNVQQKYQQQTFPKPQQPSGAAPVPTINLQQVTATATGAAPAVARRSRTRSRQQLAARSASRTASRRSQRSKRSKRSKRSSSGRRSSKRSGGSRGSRRSRSGRSDGEYDYDYDYDNYDGYDDYYDDYYYGYDSYDSYWSDETVDNGKMQHPVTRKWEPTPVVLRVKRKTKSKGKQYLV